jgi:L,D-transpeptidase catalytic domain/Putative peptidoglycan binding domain
MRRLPGAVVAGLILVLPGSAAGATPSPAVGLRTSGLFPHQGQRVLFAGEPLRLRLSVSRAAPGSVLEVRAVHHGREGSLRRSAVAGRGVVRMSVRVPAGPLVVRVRLLGPDRRVAMRKPPLRVLVIQPTADTGARGLRVRFLQRRLARLRYAIPISGRYDDATRRAVIAFRKVNRMRRVGNASRAVYRMAARGRGAFRPRRRGPPHVEGDLTRQVLALVNRGGRVHKVFMTSSGRPGLRTPTGVHRFYRKSAGWNASGMLHSAYFTRPAGGRPACAIHGYFVVPTWNASHCFFRVPVPDARKIFDWVRIGRRIHVYY